jgi:hypothetical protein
MTTNEEAWKQNLQADRAKRLKWAQERDSKKNKTKGASHPKKRS